jgi:hypothetical protein
MLAMQFKGLIFVVHQHLHFDLNFHLLSIRMDHNFHIQDVFAQTIFIQDSHTVFYQQAINMVTALKQLYSLYLSMQLFLLQFVLKSIEFMPLPLIVFFYIQLQELIILLMQFLLAMQQKQDNLYILILEFLIYHLILE